MKRSSSEALRVRPRCERLALRAAATGMWALASWSAVAMPARAHGPDMGVTEVLTWSGAAVPGLVRLTRGIAAHDGGALAFVCPSRWGGPEAPQLALVGEDVWIGGWYGPARVGSDAVLERVAGPPELMNGKVRALVSDGREAIALTTAGALWTVGPGPIALRWSASPYPDTVVAVGAGRLIVATEDQGALSLTRVAIEGEAAVAELLMPATPYRAAPTLAWVPGDVAGDAAEAAGELWLRGLGTGIYRLDRVAREGEVVTLVPVATSGTPIFGPVRYQGSTYVVVGGQPQRIVDDALEPLPETPRLFCLHAHEGIGMLVCDGPALKRYDPVGGVGETLLSVDMLRAPSIDGLDATDAFGCRAEWADVVRDTGLAGEIEAPEASDVAEVDAGAEDVAGAELEPRGDDGSGCGGGGGGELALGVAGLVASVSRARVRRLWRGARRAR